MGWAARTVRHSTRISEPITGLGVAGAIVAAGI